MIEGLVIIPLFVSVFLNIDDPSNDVSAGISHNRDIAEPINATDNVRDPSTWWSHAFGSDASFEADFRDRGIELAGPQAVWYFNGVASGRTCIFVMHYKTKKVSVARWAAIAHVTSFED